MSTLRSLPAMPALPGHRQTRSHPTLRTPEDVARFLELARSSFVLPETTVELELLTIAERHAAETRLNLHTRQCGCGAGGIAGAVALTADTAYLLLHVGAPSRWSATQVLSGAVLVLLCGSLGKVFALFRSRRALVAELSRLQRLIN